MKSLLQALLLALTVSVLAGGCAHYHLGTSVPPELRTLAVPVFDNASGQPKAEVWATQAVLAEFRREGTMKIVDREDAALEVVGRVTECKLDPIRFDHDRPYLGVEYRMTLTANVKVVERATGKVMVNLGAVDGSVIFRTQSDLPSTKRDALPRAAAMLAKIVVRETTNAW